MASYFLYAEYVCRKNGSQVTAYAAYRAGERIRNERSGQVKDCTQRDDIVHKEIVLPPDLAARPDTAWARERATLWNAVEQREKRWDARLARSWLMRLPPELPPDQRRELAVEFAKALSSKYRCAVDVCIHLPRPTGAEDSHHVHMLMTLRELTPEGLGQQTALELTPGERQQRGLTGTARQEYHELRALWADMTNAALARAGLPDRVDHRSLAEQGIVREPSPTIPRKVLYLERHTGKPCAAGEAIRTRYRERAEALEKGPEEYAQVVARQRQQARKECEARSALQAELPKKVPYGALTHEDRKAADRERYRARREREKNDPEALARRRERGRIVAKRWRDKNPEASRAASRTWRKAHPEKAKEVVANYRLAHPEKVAEWTQRAVATRRKKKLKERLLETGTKRASQKARAALRAAAKGAASVRRRNAAQQKSPTKGRGRGRGPGTGFEM